jgi:hypothetical protein
MTSTAPEERFAVGPKLLAVDIGNDGDAQPVKAGEAWASYLDHFWLENVCWLINTRSQGRPPSAGSKESAERGAPVCGVSWRISPVQDSRVS